MTDITKIAAACANRIFDRMELCRGSAMLKSDIEREVEMALREMLEGEWGPIDTEHDEHLGPLLKQVDTRCLITPKQAEERGISMGTPGYIWVDDIKPGTIIGKPYSVLTAEKEFHDAYERAKEFLAVKTIDPPLVADLRPGKIEVMEKTDPSCDFLVARARNENDRIDKFGNVVVTVKIDVQADDQDDLLRKLHRAMAEREIDPDECLGAYGWPSDSESLWFMGVNWRYDYTLPPPMAVIWHRNAVVTPCTILDPDGIIYGTCARASA